MVVNGYFWAENNQNIFISAVADYLGQDHVKFWEKNKNRAKKEEEEEGEEEEEEYKSINMYLEHHLLSILSNL